MVKVMPETTTVRMTVTVNPTATSTRTKEAKSRGLEERLERLCDRIRPKILVKFICEDGGRVER